MSGSYDPPYLYKYRSLDGTGPSSARERTRRIIADNQVWFTQADDVNDPFDCAPGFTMAAPTPAFIRYVERLFRDKGHGADRQRLKARLREIQRNPKAWQQPGEFYAAMRRATRTTVNRAGFLSLSAKRDDILMWAHYASSHTGICLRFKATEGSFPFRAAQRVTYAADRPVLNPVFDDADATMTKTFLMKADVWAYEEEWRVMKHPGSPVSDFEGRGLVTYDPDALDGIIFGCRATPADIAEVRRWVAGRKQPVELLRAAPDADRFKLDVLPLEED